MRGSIRGQTLHILNTSGINDIGKSKFQAKDRARLALGTEGRGGNSRNIAEKIGIHSLGTKDNYLDKWQELGRYVKEEFGIRDFEKITSEHIQAFLGYKMEIGVSYSHWCGYSAAFIKLNTALNNYSDIYKRGNSYSFRKTIESLRPEAKAELPRFNGTRNYANPNELISQISNQTHQLVAKIQHESGLRIAGSTSIQAPQLKGLSTDRHTGKPVGLINYIGKGGKHGTAQVSPETYKKISDHICKNNGLNVAQDGYRNSLESAARQSDQRYSGSHGLRWNFAQERFKELQGQTMSYEKALGTVSEEMGHNRIEITLHYLAVK